MLKQPASRPQQHGLVLLLTIIVLVAMSLAGIGLMRSVLSSNRVAANLAFQQSAAQSGNAGVERAIAWLERANGQEIDNPAIPAVPPKVPKLTQHHDADVPGGEAAYRAIREDPAAGTTWEAFWEDQVDNGLVNTLPEDGAGNVVSYLIHRLCVNTGDPLGGANCEASPVLNSSAATSSKSAGPKLKAPGQVYYRITVRVVGPRNAVAFSQAVVAL